MGYVKKGLAMFVALVVVLSVQAAIRQVDHPIGLGFRLLFDLVGWVFGLIGG